MQSNQQFIGAVGSWVVDTLYDNKENIWNGAKILGNFVKDGVQKLGEGIGNAVDGFFGSLGNVFG